MDKLTAIKIKYDDGTYSDEIPVSVLSENVEWDNTHTLVDVLGSINVDVTGTIQDQISQLFNEKVSNADMQGYILNSMPAYITNWLNTNVNPVGSAVIVDDTLTIEGAAADAKQVNNLRNALKTDLSYKVNIKYDKNATLNTYLTIIPGKGWNYNSGRMIDRNNRACIELTNYCPNQAALIASSGYLIYLAGNNTGIGQPAFNIGDWTASKNLNNFNYNYMFITIKRTDDTDITLDDLSKVLSLITYQDTIPYLTEADLTDIKEHFNMYPKFVRGGADTNTGYINISDSNLIRIVTPELIKGGSYDHLIAQTGIETCILYYNNAKEYLSATGFYSRNNIDIDITCAYFVILARKKDSANFDTVPTDAIYLYNSNKQLVLKKEFETILDSMVLKTWYNSSDTSISLANTVRWFLPNTLEANTVLKEIVIHSLAVGSLTIELWHYNNQNNITRDFIANYNIHLGNNIISLMQPITEATYISFIPSTSNVLPGSSNNNNEDYLYILRDKTSTTANVLDFKRFNKYKMAIDVYIYSLDNNNNIYIVGENDNVAETIIKAMRKKDSIVYIEPYTHDCIQEWEDYFGSGFFENLSPSFKAEGASSRGIELTNGIHIIGASGNLLTCHYTGNSTHVQSEFSLFNNPPGGTGYTLENINIETSKIRYCIHDEQGGRGTYYHVKYSRCRMSQDNSNSAWDRSRACIGGGLGVHGDVVVEDCIFSTVTGYSEAYGGMMMDSLAYHNGNNQDAQSSIVIKNCYCEGDSTLQLAGYGASTKKTKIIVANCSFGSAIEIYDWSGNNNFEIFQINNEIRTTS